MKACACFLLFGLALGLRRSSKKKSSSSNELPKIACPVMAAIVKRGLIQLDSKGRATQQQTLVGLMGTGNSQEMAGFQALGIAAFDENDPHQVKRVRTGAPQPSLLLNYNTWNPEAECVGSNIPNLPDGRPCNANIGFQQHGFSTTIRDPTTGRSARNRWKDWMDRKGVLTYDPSIRLFDRVMKIDGLGQLLKYMRVEGEKSGEFALTADDKFEGSPLQFYHPNASSPEQYLPCSQWQAVGAWAAFWAAFARVTSDGKTYFMPKDDLERFFEEADFPKDWSAKPWGFKESFKVVREMKGMGIGDEWVAQIENILNTFGEEASEQSYTQGMLIALTAIGSRIDDVNKPMPPTALLDVGSNSSSSAGCGIPSDGWCCEFLGDCTDFDFVDENCVCSPSSRCYRRWSRCGADMCKKLKDRCDAGSESACGVASANC